MGFESEAFIFFNSISSLTMNKNLEKITNTYKSTIKNTAYTLLISGMLLGCAGPRHTLRKYNNNHNKYKQAGLQKNNFKPGKEYHCPKPQNEKTYFWEKLFSKAL
jgi:hypothetical protein